MNLRYQETLDAVVASSDLAEMESIHSFGEASRQSFAAETSQNSYRHMLTTQDALIYDYTSSSAGIRTKKTSPLVVTSLQREEMVEQITELHKVKEYRSETLFVAVGIADRYLAYLY